MNLGQYIANIILEEQDPSPSRYQSLIQSKLSELNHTSEIFNVKVDDLQYAFETGNEVLLSDNIWSKLENTNSYKIKSLKQIDKLVKNWKPIFNAIKNEEQLPLPMVLEYGEGKYYLVAGNTQLMIYRALEIKPTVLIGTLGISESNHIFLKEYSDKLVKNLIDKFKKEKPNLGLNIIQSYINRFAQIKNSPRVTEKDITKYSWKELETVVDANQPKRIKAGKINDGEPSKDANLVYNQNGLRIYVGKTKQACIKYGNGYSFCISARGENNLYSDYRYEQRGTPYFVFDDTKSSEQDEEGFYGNFIDPTHLLVVFVYNDGEVISEYSVTTADNPGEDRYLVFDSIEKKYPRLKGLKNIFKPVEGDPKEKSEYFLNQKYDGLLGYINESYGNRGGKNYIEDFWEKFYFDSIKYANNKIDDLINNKTEVYKFKGKLKKEDKYKYDWSKISQFRIVKSGNEEELNKQYKDFIENIIMPAGDESYDEAIYNWEITYEKTDISKTYLEDVKKLVDKYRNELSKLRLVKENLQSKIQRLNEEQTGTISEFIKYSIKNLGLKKLPSSLTLSYNNDEAKEKCSFGYFDPNSNKIWIYVKNRNMADILRTLAHELVHRKQEEDGRLDAKSGETGSPIEDEANAMAGVLLRNFGKINNSIYEAKEFGNYLFGDKDSGVKIGWYNNELEPDTTAEKSLFDFLKKYADSEESTYSNINLDNYIPIFKTIKKQYPEIGDPKISGYIYRGTVINKDALERLSKEPNIDIIGQNIIIPNQEYSSRRKVSSWSTNYYNAATFAMSTAERKKGIPVVMRAKAEDAELFFTPKFMNKLSNQLEEETFNIINPIPVDIMIIKEYEDEFEDIEKDYLHTKK